VRSSGGCVPANCTLRLHGSCFLLWAREAPCSAFSLWRGTCRGCLCAAWSLLVNNVSVTAYAAAARSPLDAGACKAGTLCCLRNEQSNSHQSSQCPLQCPVADTIVASGVYSGDRERQPVILNVGFAVVAGVCVVPLADLFASTRHPSRAECDDWRY
jgi:hypothetical protein